MVTLIPIDSVITSPTFPRQAHTSSTYLTAFGYAKRGLNTQPLAQRPYQTYNLYILSLFYLSTNRTMRLKPCQNIGSPIERGALAEVTERSVVVPQTAEREGVILIEHLTIELGNGLSTLTIITIWQVLFAKSLLIGTVDNLRIPIDW